MAEPWTEIGDRVFVRRHESLDLNVGAVLADGGVVIIDTRANPRQAHELSDSLRAITTDPVRWIINTHHHWDHTFGNQVFSGAAIWGHVRCAEVLRDRGEAMRDRLISASPDRGHDFAEVVITPPQHTFPERAVVAFGGVEVDMRFVGRGHTDNDIAITLPGRGVVFAGDLIEEGAPPSFGDSFPFEWPATLERLEEIAGDVVVPGHGGIGSAGFIAMQRGELDEVAELARERHAAGANPAEAAALGGPYPASTLEAAFTRAWTQMGSA